MVIGGGLAGAAAACTLARGGRRVLVMERTREPAHKICGEFLGGVAREELARLGVEVRRLGAAPIDTLRITRGARVIEARLPFPAAGLSRLRLDAALLDAAESAGAEVRRDVRVQQIEGERIATDHGDIRGAGVLLATGKSELRDAKRRVAGKAQNLVGFKMHYRLDQPQRIALARSIELHLFADTYAGLQPIENGMANLCFTTDAARLSKAGSFAALLAELTAENPHLTKRLAGATPLFARPLTIARVPYGFVHKPLAGERAFRLGDQLGVIPSFAGEGMAIALRSGRLAGRCLAEDGTPAAFHARMRRDVRRPIAAAGWLYRIGRTRAGQAALFAACGHWPGSVRLLARVTRIDARET